MPAPCDYSFVYAPAPGGEFHCDYGAEAIPLSMRCDGVPQCADLSDEVGCPPMFVCGGAHDMFHLDGENYKAGEESHYASTMGGGG